jgi:hypothetical protein
LKTKELEGGGLEKRFEGMDVKKRAKFPAFIRGMWEIDPVQGPSAKQRLEED